MFNNVTNIFKRFEYLPLYKPDKKYNIAINIVGTKNSNPFHLFSGKNKNKQIKHGIKANNIK